MKKIFKSLFVLGLFVLVAAGCAKTETKTYTLEQNGMKMEFVFKAKGDKVIEQTAKTTVPYDLLGVTNKDDAKTMMEASTDVSSYEGITGLEHSIDYTDDAVVENVKLDYEKVDIDEVSSLPGMYFDGDAKDGVSLKKTVKMLEDMGATEKK